MAVYPTFPGGKRKAFTMSYDDGWTQDEKLISLMNQYGIKGTFNLNSGDALFQQIENPRERYKGHEVAAHGYHHAYLGRIAAPNAAYDVMKDRETLEQVFGGTVRGYAYGYGSYNPETPEILKTCGIKYARTIKKAQEGKFLLPEDWYFFHPTCEDRDPELMTYANRFLNMRPMFTQCHLFYVWGHSCFTEREDLWGTLEELFQKISAGDEIWCATNIEIYDYLDAFRHLVTSANGKYIYNPTTTTLSLICDSGDFMNKRDTFEIKPGEERYLD